MRACAPPDPRGWCQNAACHALKLRRAAADIPRMPGRWGPRGPPAAARSGAAAARAANQEFAMKIGPVDIHPAATPAAAERKASSEPVSAAEPSARVAAVEPGGAERRRGQPGRFRQREGRAHRPGHPRRQVPDQCRSHRRPADRQRAGTAAEGLALTPDHAARTGTRSTRSQASNRACWRWARPCACTMPRPSRPKPPNCSARWPRRWTSCAAARAPASCRRRCASAWRWPAARWRRSANRWPAPAPRWTAPSTCCCPARPRARPTRPPA